MQSGRVDGSNASPFGRVQVQEKCSSLFCTGLFGWVFGVVWFGCAGWVRFGLLGVVCSGF